MDIPHFSYASGIRQGAFGSKRELRQHFQRQLGLQTPDQRLLGSRCLCSLLKEWFCSDPFDTLLAVVPREDEPDLFPWLRTLSGSGTNLAFPRIALHGLEFRLCDTVGPWELHPQGVRQPVSSQPVWVPAAGERILALIPGLAFAPGSALRPGYQRLGRGRGYFDRFLSARPQGLTAVGYGFGFQMVGELSLEPHDQLLDGLILGPGSDILEKGVHLWH